MTPSLTFSCRCGETFTTSLWVGWGSQADATCPRCAREVTVETDERAKIAR